MRQLRPSSREGETDDLVRWRVGRLRAGGFPEELAGELARDRSYDLHALLDLVDRGCPPELAVRILAPLDSEIVHAPREYRPRSITTGRSNDGGR